MMLIAACSVVYWLTKGYGEAVTTFSAIDALKYKPDLWALVPYTIQIP